jgi:hypothetical protein
LEEPALFTARRRGGFGRGFSKRAVGPFLRYGTAQRARATEPTTARIAARRGTGDPERSKGRIPPPTWNEIVVVRVFPAASVARTVTSWLPSAHGPATLVVRPWDTKGPWSMLTSYPMTPDPASAPVHDNASVGPIAPVVFH